MVGFYCGTQFHIFESVFLKNLYFPDEEAVLFIVSPLEQKDYLIEAFYELGFSKVVAVDSCQPYVDILFDQVFFFSIFTHYPDYMKKLKTKKMILGYDGITTFMLNHWRSTDPNNPFDYDRDIDEIWIPSKALLLDDEYIPKCKEFSFDLKKLILEEKELLCEKINRAFRYHHKPISAKTLFMDRYLTKYSNVFFDVAFEKILTQTIYYGIGEAMAIKRHPYDTYYKDKYAGLEQIEVLEDNVPWELVYLNEHIHNRKDNINKFIVYNSFAPANQTLLFGNKGYGLVCIEPILDKYSQIRNTFLNSDLTLQIFKRFSETFGIKVEIADSFLTLASTKKKKFAETDLKKWECAEEKLKIAPKFLLSFHIQIDSMLFFLSKDSGKYYLLRNETDGEITENALVKILGDSLPSFKRTNNMKKADICIYMRANLEKYREKDYDIRKSREIYISLDTIKEYEEIYKQVITKKNIYIWGASTSNLETLRLIEEMGFKDRVRMIFDSYASGTRQGIPVVRFDKRIIEPESIIIICANLAYKEIEHILQQEGLRKDIDYTFGIGKRE